MKILLILFLTAAFAFSKKVEVNWHIAKFPPFMNIDDDHRDGICIDGMNTAIEKLDNYEHKVSVVPFSRTMEEMKVLDLVCFPCLLKNKDREKNMYFSKSFTALAMQLGLVVKKKSAKKIEQYLSSDNTIDLKKLLDSKIFKLGISNGRSYGNKIDSIIKKHLGQDNLYKRSGTNISEGIFKMMIANRDIDGTILYNTKLDLLLNKYKKVLNKDFLFLKIKDIPLVSFLHIACSKTKHGEIFINNLNKNIIDIRKSAILFQNKMKRENSTNVDKLTPIWNEMIKKEEPYK